MLNARLIDLVMRAEDLQEQGRPVTADELCRDCPELWPELQRLLSGVAQVNRLLRPDSATRATADKPASWPAFVTREIRGYQILREIGRGGMGIVYEAVQTSLDRRVALKVLPDLALRDPRQVQRFEREARLVARLHHTNIVPVYGIGVDNGLHYFAMEFIAGLSLEKVLANLQRLRKIDLKNESDPLAKSPGERQEPGARHQPSADEESHPLSPLTPFPARLSESGRPYWHSLARIGLQAAQALDYAHGQGVLHRDIKPSNLILDGQGTVWVTDFGMGKVVGDDDQLTHTGDVVGTLRYLAPERFRGEADARADIYSLGLTLYEMLTLRPAFAGADRHELVHCLLHDEPPRPRKLNSRVPLDLETIVLKAIARDKSQRFQTAGDLAADLARFLADEPIKARRVGPWERLRRWARRNRGVAAALAVIGLLLTVVAIGSSVAAVRFRQARDDADTARTHAEKAAAAERWEHYRADIAAASAALQLQNSNLARNALEAAPQQYRNWEWAHLHNQLEGASRVIAVPEGVVGVTLSPDGRQVATSSGDNAVYLWDANSTSATPAHVLRGHAARIRDLAYRRDGGQFATASDEAIRLWDPATGRQSFVLAAKGLASLTYSVDGRRLLTNDAGGTCRLWDTVTGKQIAIPGERPPHDNGSVVSFMPDSKRVAATAGKFVRLYDAATGRERASLGPHEWIVGGITVSPDGKRICTRKVGPGNGPDTVYLWDAETGRLVAKLIDHKAQVTVRFSNDSKLLATASAYPENLVRLCDAATGKLLHTLSGHTNSASRLCFSPDGAELATASIDQTARLWDVKTGAAKAVLRGHSAELVDVTFSPDGRRLVTSALDHTIRLWDAATGDLITVLRGHGANVSGQQFTPDGARLISFAADGTVRIWDVALLERNGVLRGHSSFVYDVAFSPDGAHVASAAWDGTARLWDATTGLQTGLLKHAQPWVTALAYSRDGHTLATAPTGLGSMLWDLKTGTGQRASAWNGTGSADHGRVALSPDGKILAYARHWVRLYDTDAKAQIAELPAEEIGVPELGVFSPAVVFSPDGSVLVTGAWDGTIRIWDTRIWHSLAELHGHAGGENGAVYRLAFSPDGSLLASGSLDNTVQLWDVRTHEHLATINMGSWVFGLAFSPDGTRLATGCRDHTIRLIDVASRQEVAELRGHTDYVHAVAWSPDGTQLVSGSGDGMVRIWDSLSIMERAKRSAKALQSKAPTTRHSSR
jgi:WD40 repeat protein/serine/threonine protein kinase